MENLVLASRSPRRCELLNRIGLVFETDAPDVDETCSLPAGEAVRILSLRKAQAAAESHPGSFILAADTLVSFREEALGKPLDPPDAIRMLRMLSGQTHQVYTGVTVISPDGRVFTDSDRTDVTFASVDDAEIADYVRSGEPMDKAGAYALQGRAGMWVTHLDGSDTSVIGLPLYLVRSLLLQAGYPLLAAAGTHHIV
ncbi:Maf family protein [Aristaeella hokkaidonensis]|uniref:Septum formation protein Maf n=1 Tax=Aristaeella hokkaidonensis TaxID=3046382 RepID=A0AC61MY87_9FIRM|nr:Maf family protein [Aristaeella hokkaidonensis]QUC68045.1 septum formation protein Maf [Aristaeella hokkaidonensis]SNT93115.1 septum formation protein [Aristaeella hokkaidonensis]